MANCAAIVIVVPIAILPNATDNRAYVEGEKFLVFVIVLVVKWKKKLLL